MLGVNPSIILKFIRGEIIFEVFQPMCSRYLNVTDGQTVRQTTYYGITALCIASHGKKERIIWQFETKLADVGMHTLVQESCYCSENRAMPL